MFRECGLSLVSSICFCLFVIHSVCTLFYFYSCTAFLARLLEGKVELLPTLSVKPLCSVSVRVVTMMFVRIAGQNFRQTTN